MHNRRRSPSAHLRSDPKQTPLGGLRGRNLNGRSESLFRIGSNRGALQLHLPFTCRYHRILRKTLRSMPSTTLYVVEITFSRGFESYLRSHSFNRLGFPACCLR
jgi:hypothetical protein